VKSAAIQPGDDERSRLGERMVDGGSRETTRTGPDREPGAARVLRLHGEDPLDDRFGCLRFRTGEQLGRDPARDDVRSHHVGTVRHGHNVSGCSAAL
jgi:hypothetical protein